MRRSTFAVAAALAFLAFPAAADEVFVGLYDHDVDLNVTVSGYEPGASFQLGWRGEPSEPLRAIGRPSPYALASVNTEGASNFVAAGLSWKVGDRVYFRPGLGVAYVDYEAGRADRIDYGSHVVFAPEVAVGWRVSERTSVEASWIHLSHAQLFSKQNPGMDAVGIRVNRRF